MRNIKELQVKTLIIILLAVGFLLFVYKVGDRDLWAPDEDEYAQISREMIRTNNWIFPTVNGEPWTIKPVLYNWLVSAISLPWGDVDEFRARIFGALAALGTVLVTFHIGKIAFTPAAGFLGALVLATSALFLHHGRWAQTYMLSTFFATLAIYLFFRGYRNADKRTISYLLLYAAAALGVLTMGPVNLAIPGLVIFFYLVVMKDLKHILKMRLISGILIFSAIALPWYVLVGSKGEYGSDLLISTNILRYFTALHHDQPFYYYFKDIPWAFFPWSLFLPSAFLLTFSKRSKDDQKSVRFILVWIIILFVFFSISRGKRPQYILSIYPAFALLIGYLGHKALQFWQERYYRRAIIIPSIVLLVILAFIAIAAPVATGIYFKQELGLAIGMGVIAGIFALLIGFAWREKRPQQLMLLPAGFMLVFIIYGVHFLIPRMEAYKSPRPFCDEIVTRVEKGADWAMYQFYRAIYVYYTDSFAKVLKTEEELNRFLDRPNQSIVALPESGYHRLSENLKAKSHIIYQRKIGHRPMVLISNIKE
jgi:4-amino-4-deoxy-L-arabinose transferase-like glycosyltransferase